MRRFVQFLLAILTLAIPLAANPPKPFIVCDLHGQFGNQLFQIATAVSLAKDHDAIALFPDLNEMRDNIKINYFTIFKSLNASKPNKAISTLYNEPSLQYQPIPFTSNMRMHGFFQCEDFFKHHRALILKLFAPPPTIVTYLREHYPRVINDPKTVSIHVRTYGREPPHVKELYAFNGRSYVQKAMTHFPADSHYIVFSDDIKWCKKNLSDLSPHMRFIEGESYFHDFYLQSMCKNHIISNSSFSWWAAWLNNNPNKIVVAPIHWFTGVNEWKSNDIVPKSWIQESN